MRDDHAYDLSTLAEFNRKDALMLLRQIVPVRFPRSEPTIKALSEGKNSKGEPPRFRCVHCGDMTPLEDGGCDILPFGCSTCYAKAHDALVARPDICWI